MNRFSKRIHNHNTKNTIKLHEFLQDNTSRANVTNTEIIETFKRITNTWINVGAEHSCPGFACLLSSEKQLKISKTDWPWGNAQWAGTDRGEMSHWVAQKKLSRKTPSPEVSR